MGDAIIFIGSQTSVVPFPNRLAVEALSVQESESESKEELSKMQSRTLALMGGDSIALGGAAALEKGLQFPRPAGGAPESGAGSLQPVVLIEDFQRQRWPPPVPPPPNGSQAADAWLLAICWTTCWCEVEVEEGYLGRGGGGGEGGGWCMFSGFRITL